MKNPFKSIASWSSEAKAGLALSLGAVVIFTSAVVLSNNEGSSSIMSSNNLNTSTSNPTSNGNQTTSSNHVTSPTTPEVDVMLEEFIRPYEGNQTAKHFFYNAEDPIEKRKMSIIKVPGTQNYIKSLGVDYVNEKDETFNVVASLSGQVLEKMNDPMYGNIVVIEHKSGVKLYYASLENIKFNKGDEVKQGQVIATSGTSLYTSDFKSSLHFEILKDGKHINPETAYSNSVQEI